MLRILLFFFSFQFVQPAFSQTPFFKQFFVNRENNSLTCNKLCIDNTGLIWTGTSEGLFQYDGNDFIPYYINGDKSLNNVTALYEAGDSTLWVGYKSGRIAQLKNGLLQPFNIEEGFPTKPISSIMQTKAGVVWITTAGEGVYFYKNNRLYNIDEDDGLNDNYSYTSIEDVKGSVWVATDQGIAICNADVNNKISRKITRSDGLPDEIVRCLKKDSGQNIWIGTQDKGICKHDLKTNKIETPPLLSNWNYGQVNNFILTENECWIATDENGIISYNSFINEFLKNYRSYGGFSFGKSNDIIKDREGNLWIASQSGLIKSAGNCLLFLNETSGRKLNFIHAILGDKSGNIYFTPDQQLVKITFGPNGITEKEFVITPADELIDITSLYEDKWGYIWIGTMGDGLYRLNPYNGRKIKLSGYGPVGDASILSIAGDSNQLWLATLGGVIKCEIRGDGNTDNIQTHFYGLETQKETGNYFIYKVFIDSRKRIWYGTDGRGILCYEGNKFINYSQKDGLKSDVIYSITEDDKGHIWFSSADAGIYSFDGKKFTNYNLVNGLRELTASNIIYDKNGNIVVIHKRGIDFLDIKTGVVSYFGAENNLEEIFPDLNAASLDSKGNLWIGTQKGIVIFNSRFKPAGALPVSLIKKITVLTDSSFLEPGEHLKYNRNNLSVSFTSVWYSDPAAIRYQYMLEGYSKGWVTTRDKEIVFPNLQPGQYTFRLKSATGNNFANAAVVSFPFTVNHPWWNQWWFLATITSVIIAIAVIYIRWRENESRKQEKNEKEKIKLQLDTLMSQVSPHFLFNSFNTLVAIIESDPEIAVEYVQHLSEFFRNLVTYRDKELIFLDEEMKLSSAYFFLQQKRFGKHLQMSINIGERKNEFMLPPLVVQLLIENAIKHNAVSKETPLCIEITAHTDVLTVKNNINLKRNTVQSTQTGLQNIISRYKLVTKREVQISKTISEFIVTIPIVKLSEK